MSRGATVPVYSRRRSDSVVFPWSTCAITDMARVSLVGVDTRRSLSAQRKGRPGWAGPWSGRLLGRGLLWNPFGRVVRSLGDAAIAFARRLRVSLRRIAHRFAAADFFALDARILDHQVPPWRD